MTIDGRFIALIIPLVIVFMVIVSWMDQRKLRLEIKNSWGKVSKNAKKDSKESLREVWKLHQKHRNLTKTVDDMTWSDLDFDQLYYQINATQSSIGAEYLFTLLRNNQLDQKKMTHFRHLVTYFKENSIAREKVQLELSRVGKKNQNFVWHYLYAESLPFIKYEWVYYLLGSSTFLSVLLFLITLQPLFVLLAIFLVCFNMLVYFFYKIKIETELGVMSYLVNLIAVSKSIGSLTFPEHERMKKNANRLTKIGWFGFAFRKKSDTMEDILFEYINIAFMVPFIAYNFVLRELRKYLTEAREVTDFLGEIDAAIAVANYQEILPYYCEPEFIKEKKIDGTASYHSLVENPVANDVLLDKYTLVTGSNASGKSTYLKSIAINAILAQTIGLVLARKWSMYPGEVYTSMTIKDNLFAGESYFIAEIKSVRRMLTIIEQGRYCYTFIDEILRGTNTIERIAASSTVVHWLSQKIGLGYVATHDIELTGILGSSCKNSHFREDIAEDGKVIFNYQLHSGPSKTRNAITLLKQLNYPEKVTSEAEQAADFFVEKGYWKKNLEKD